MSLTSRVAMLLLDGISKVSDNLSKMGQGMFMVGNLAKVWMKLRSPYSFSFIKIIQKPRLQPQNPLSLFFLLIYCMVAHCDSSPMNPKTLYITALHEMRPNCKQTDPKRQKPDESRSSLRPFAYEMKSYQTSGIIEQLAFMLVRPPRFHYNPDILKPSKLSHFQIPFELTLYSQQETKYVLLYLHGNGSSRFQGTLFLSSLPDGVALACFDFSGCGLRNQEGFITLGQQECKDVDVAAVFLKEKGYIVVGWGRSMGAVSLLMSKECDIMVADSAYSNLPSLCKESSSKFLPKACCCFFHCLFPCVFACIKSKVSHLAGLSIEEMKIAAKLQEMPETKQICFIHGQADTLVPSHHSQELHSAFKGRKRILLFQGTHNSSRPIPVIMKCFEFIEEGLHLLYKNKKEFSPDQVSMGNAYPLTDSVKMQKKEGMAVFESNHELMMKPQPQSNIEPFEKKPQEEYLPLQNEKSGQLKELVEQQYAEIGVSCTDTHITRPLPSPQPNKTIIQ